MYVSLQAAFGFLGFSWCGELAAACRGGLLCRVDGSGIRRSCFAAWNLGQAQCPAQVGIDFSSNIRIVLQKLADVFTYLADALALVAEPGAALLDHAVYDA